LDDSSFPYRILIVEDDPRLREVGKLVLETQGYEVHVAGDGFEALIALKRSLPDIIISDLSMPNMNGFELLSVVRRRFPTIPVIVISGEFSVLTVPESVLADAFFPKRSVPAGGVISEDSGTHSGTPFASAHRQAGQSGGLGEEQQGNDRGDLYRLFANISGARCQQGSQQRSMRVLPVCHPL
jgi:CheY-like chemotaxis protein